MLKKRNRTGMQSAFVRHLKTSVRGYILRGMLVLVPLGVTAYVLVLCYRLTAGHLAPPLRKYVGEMPEYAIVILSIAIFVLILYSIGFTASLVIGRRFIALGESFLKRIPIVKTIYGASQQAVDALSTEEGAQSYQAAVVVPFPSPEAKAIAFVTGKLDIEGEGIFYRVFVPTTPNPTSGYFMIYPPESIEHTNLTVEDALKAIISAGILTPKDFQLVEGADVSTIVSPVHAAEKRPVHVQRSPLQALQKRLISGLLVLVPIGITIFIVNFIYDLTAGRIAPIAQRIAGPSPYATAIVSIALMLVTLYITGYFATAVFGARLIRFMEYLLGRIPFVPVVYGATKQIVETIVNPDSGPKFEEPVLATFPHPGVRVLGFVVGRMKLINGPLYIKVFVPTAPNITVGFLELYQSDHVSGCSMTLEEALKMVVSCGIVGPEKISLKPIAESAQSVEEAVPAE
jgi:uncharacterized membrane protein